MQKQYKTLTENIIYVVRNMGPVTANEIQHELKKTYNLSGAVMKIWQGLAGIMGRGFRGPEKKQVFHYFISPQHIDKSVETLYGLYRTGKYKREEKVEPYKVAPAAALSMDELMEKVEDDLSKQLGLEVKVSGEIRVVFGWAK